jgi:hypothetical protein
MGLRNQKTLYKVYTSVAVPSSAMLTFKSCQLCDLVLQRSRPGLRDALQMPLYPISLPQQAFPSDAKPESESLID